MKMNVLVIEDDAASMNLLTEVLQSAGWNITKSGSAEEALRLLEDHPLDLILTDIMLPGVDGLSFARKLKLAPKTRDIPIVAITANTFCDETLALDAGCEALLTKPMDTRHVVERLLQIIACRHAAPHPLREPGSRPVEVLVIEDDPVSLRLAGAVLLSGGYLVSVAVSAEQAKESVLANRPDVILLDLNLPGTTGMEFARHIKDEPLTAGIPIIAVTGYPQIFQKQNAMRSGCDSYLVKPIDTRGLGQEISDAMVHAAPVQQTKHRS